MLLPSIHVNGNENSSLILPKNEENISNLSLFSISQNITKYNITNSTCKHTPEFKTIPLDAVFDIFAPGFTLQPLSEQKNIKFLIKHDRRGQKPKTSNNNYMRNHRRTDFDNLQTKIQVHFISFIINLSNSALSTEFGEDKYNFKDIPYNIKRDVSFKASGYLHNSAIKDILQNKISNKFKTCEDKYINRYILNKVCSESIWLKEFFNMKYINLFEKYYNNAKPLESFFFNGKKIALSARTKSFYDLLLKNQDDKNLLIETARSVYFYGYKGLFKKNSFKIKTDTIDIK